ncbi:hypothetical protein L211DRAFT_836331 [Terfezia boudieri ATCC MYA-4762]|uniref:Uncharacterized protein n=1 Tax=Terfezia boudieri ATCC MYA-4762 TaxID=1051890 RepID=A0A3N4LRR1_9PEZI|nr:hypothetical protein L211DRAFT_836331 [Terfezia boudieri ATCC MYA-4762]
MAQFSTTISQDQRATAFHFFTSNRFFPSVAGSLGLPALAAAFPFAPDDAAGASAISTSAIL